MVYWVAALSGSLAQLGCPKQEQLRKGRRRSGHSGDDTLGVLRGTDDLLTWTITIVIVVFVNADINEGHVHYTKSCYPSL